MNRLLNGLGILLIVGIGNALAQNTFPATGNVGIGTTAPSSLLQVGAPGVQVGGVQINATDVIGAPLPLQISDHTNGLMFGGNTFGRQIRLSRNANSYVYDIGLDSSNQFFIMNQNSAIEGFVIGSSGNVGIGTTSPGAPLEVNGSVKLTSGSGASMTYADGTVQSTAWNGTTLGGDYAEAIDVLGDRSTYEPGDVIVIDAASPGRFEKSSKAYSKLVAGVYSTKPGLVGRRLTFERVNKAAEVPMAMLGIVPTKVTTENGPIEPGDLLVSASKPGYAMKGTDSSRAFGAVLGKALAPLTSGDGVIEVMISIQ